MVMLHEKETGNETNGKEVGFKRNQVLMITRIVENKAGHSALNCGKT